MNTRAHQNRITTLAQQAVDVKQYFRFWTRDTTLTLDIIRTLQHLSLLSRTPPKCHCGADKQLYQAQHFTDGWEYRCSRHGSSTRESIRHDSWFYQKKHPIAHYIVMIRLLDSKSSFQQVMDEVGITRKCVRKHWLEMCSSMQRYMDALVYDTVPLFDCNEIVEIDEAYMHWKAGVLTVQWGDEVVVEEGGDWVVGLISRHSDDRPQRIKLFLAEGRAREDLIDEIEDAIQPNALVYTDALSTYTALKENYRHYIINKKEEGFSKIIHPLSEGRLEVHVNTIESTWKRLRQLARERHINRPADVPALCTEFLYRFYGLPWYDLLRAREQGDE